MNIEKAKDKLQQVGYLELDDTNNIDFAAEIKRLKKEKNAVILAHY